MPSEPTRHEAHGVLVLAREIIAHGRTINLRDVRDLRIRPAGPSAVTWGALVLLLLLAAAAFVYAFTRETLGTLSLLLLGGGGVVVLGIGIFLALSLGRKALVVITPKGEVPVAYARNVATLEPLWNAIRSAAGAAGGEQAVPRWGTALWGAANQQPPDTKPPSS